MTQETLYQKPLKEVYKIAERWFHKWIRIRDIKKRGHCITCQGGIEEAGHFNHGGNNKYAFWCDFDERNLNGQCKQCNHFYSGRLNIYSGEIKRMYGADMIDELNALNWKSEVWGKEDLIRIIEECKKKIKENT